jgi:hypothetical protein
MIDSSSDTSSLSAWGNSHALEEGLMTVEGFSSSFSSWRAFDALAFAPA